MKTIYLFLFIVAVALGNSVNAQGVAINSTSAAADASSILDVSSTTQGMLIPRMTMAERDAILILANGLIIYQTDNSPGIYAYDGANWDLAGSNTTTYGEMYEANALTGGSEVFLENLGVFYPWVSAGTGEVNNVTFTDGGANADFLTVAETGTYKISVSISFTADAAFFAPFDFSAAVYIEDAQSPKLIVHRNISSFNVGSASITGIVNLTAGDELDLRFSSYDEDEQTINIYVCDMNLIRLK